MAACGRKALKEGIHALKLILDVLQLTFDPTNKLVLLGKNRSQLSQ
jgi:hypothetical protein